MRTSLALSALVPFLAVTQAYFILSHPVLETTRLDPIVQPGIVSQHVHSVVGGSNFDKTMTYTSARNSTCTTAPVTQDKSNYWTPQLYYYNPSTTMYKAIPVAYVNTYYLNRYGDDGAIRAFPDGLRMMSGNPYRRTFNDDADSKAVTFVCLDYDNDHSGDPAWAERNSFFEHNCPSGMRAQVFFRSCWDGVNLDSSDHISHMAWPSGGVDGGNCPSTHPVRLVSLFYEFIYNVQNFPFNDLAYPTWVFANGDTTGYGMHGDFLNGWPEYNNGTNILQQALEQCNSNNGVGGDLVNCPPFVDYLDSASASACQPTNDLIDEDVGFDDWLTQLPGNNPIWIGNSTTKPSYANYTETANYTDFKSTIPSGYSYVGCIAEGSTGRALTGASLSASNMSRSVCVSHCQSLGYPLAGVEYGKECYCDYAMRNSASNTTLLDSTECAVNCAGNSYEHCGGSSTLDLWVNPSLFPDDTLPTGWSTLGCYTELSTGRALSSYSFSSSSMTRALCLTTCKSKGYTLAGAEYKSECYCGNALASGSSTASDSSCSMACSGDSFHTCGGSSRLNVFRYSNGSTTATTSAVVSSSSASLNGTSSTSKASTAVTPSSSSVNSTSTSKSASSTVSATSTTSSSVSTSVSTSKSSSSMSTSVNSTTSSTSTTTSTVISTSTSASATATLPSGWSALGCYKDSSTARMIGGPWTSTATNTQESCVATCNASGYRYAGVEYGAECYCGDTLLPSLSSTTGCTMACSGDSGEVCGASGKINIFTNANAAPVSSSVPTGWTSNGCYTDSSTDRALPSYSFSSSSMTHTLCTSTCLSKGYTFAGVEYGNQCYCASQVASSSLSSSSNLCEYICAGDSSTRCGGKNHISIFSRDGNNSTSTSLSRKRSYKYPPSF